MRCLEKWLNKNEIRAFKHNKNSTGIKEDTEKERKSIEEYIHSISKPTDVSIYKKKTITERLKEFVNHIDKEIDKEYIQLPLSEKDSIRKNSYCFALEKCKIAIENILNEKDFDYVEE